MATFTRQDYMEPIEQLAQAALARDHFKLRSLVQDLTRSKMDFGKVTRPLTSDEKLLAMSAALVELLASRNKQTPPAWTKEIGPLAACRRDPVGEKPRRKTHQKRQENHRKPLETRTLGDLNWSFSSEYPSLRQPAS